MKFYKIECLNQDGHIECNGYFCNKHIAEDVAKELNNFTINKIYGIVNEVIEIETEDDFSNKNKNYE